MGCLRLTVPVAPTPAHRQVPLPATVIQALAQTAAIFIQAYRVAPTIVTRWREQQQPGTGRDDGPVPLQCGSPLRPEHSALLSCRPLALQVLLGLAMVAWPVGLAWAVDRRLRRQHAAVCREWVRQQRGRQQGQQQDVCRAPANTQQQQRLPACRGAVLRGNGHRGVHTGSVSGSAGKAPDASPRQQTPAEAPAAGPCPGTARGSGGPRPSARYRSRMSSAMVTIKVCCKCCSGWSCPLIVPVDALRCSSVERLDCVKRREFEMRWSQ